MLGIVLGIFTIGLGAKAFAPGGLPLSRKKNLTGTGAKVIGIVCILLGAVFVIDGILAVLRLLSRG